MEIAHLHCHSEYSMLKGVGNIEKWYEIAKKKGIPALAFTEHANMGSSLASYIASKKHNVKCIFGIQILVVLDLDTSVQEETLILLAKNEVGYKNLLKLSKFSYTKGFDSKRQAPRVDLATLTKYRKGLYALTGSLTGSVAVASVAGYDVAREAFKQLHDIYGKNLKAEIQLTEEIEQQNYNKLLIKLSKEFDTEIVLTNDCHYVSKKGAKLQEILDKMSRSKAVGMKYQPLGSKQKWLKTYNQLNIIRKRLHGYITQSMFDKMVNSANKIAENCNVEIPIGHHSLPKYDVPSHPLYKDGMNNIDLFMHIAEEGFKHKVAKHPNRMEKKKQYRKQFEYEIKVISDAGFIDYFLIVQDIILWAKHHDVEVGAARGSVAGSLVAFCMDITDIDPIKFDLMFERFLNPTRVSGERAKSADALPDIDIDFERTRRPDVKRYIIEKYGAERVCTIGSYQTMKMRSLLRDLHRMFDGNIPIDEDGNTEELSVQALNSICRYLEDNKLESLEKALKDKEFKKFRKKYKYFVDYYCSSFEEQIKAVSRHAAGVLITPTKLTDWIPVRTQKVEDEEERVLVSQWEDIYCERIGLLKLDILGIKMLDIFKYARQLIQERHGVTIDIRDMENNLEDRKVLKKFSKGETEGVFQYNSALQASYMVDLGNVSFEDLITANAALRPGPMDADAHKIYVALKHGDEEPHYDHEMLKKYLKKTLGLYIYQEDVMRTAHVLGGLSLAESDIMRSAIKKKDASMIADFKDKFIDGCVKNGLTKEHGSETWDKLIAFSTYGFNRSHSASYAYLGFFCQWIKVYYPIEFWTATLQFASDDVKKSENIWKFREPILKSRIEILAPSALRPKADFYIVKDKIVWPIRAIKGVGIKAAHAIAQACKKHKPKSMKEFFDFIPRRVANKKVVSTLIAAGTFIKFGSQYQVAEEYFVNIRKEDLPEQFLLDKKDEEAWEDLRDKTLGFLERSYKERYSDWFGKKITTVASLASADEHDFLLLGGKVSRIFEHKGWSGKMMFLTITDVDGSFPVFISPEFLKRLEKKPKVGDIVELFGRKGYTKRNEDELLLNTRDCELEIYNEKV